jgi:hypothetical protein
MGPHVMHLAPLRNLGLILSTLFYLGCSGSAFTGAGKNGAEKNVASPRNNESNQKETRTPNILPKSDADITTVGTLKCKKNVDLVFSIDVSTSMGFVLNALGDGIAEVWRKAEEMGFETRFGLVVFVDDARIPKRGSYDNLADLQNAFRYWYGSTLSNNQTNSTQLNFDFPENSLDAIGLALDKFEWRENVGKKIIIHATDDTFLEAPAIFSSGIRVMNTCAQILEKMKNQDVNIASFIDISVPEKAVGFASNYGNKESLSKGVNARNYDIRGVASRTLSMASAISEFIVAASCE